MDQMFSVASIFKFKGLSLTLATILLICLSLKTNLLPIELLQAQSALGNTPPQINTQATTPKSPPEKITNSNPTTNNPATTNNVATDPNQLVLAAVRQAVWGPSIACRVQQTTKAYGQQALWIGEFKSEALATTPMRRLRYTARVAVGETAFDFIQVSDGRILWTQSTPSGAPKRIILDQVLQNIPSGLQYPDSRPEIHLMLAVGGQAELLRGLYHRYNWYKAVSGKIAGADVWQLVGRLRTEPTRIAGNAPIDNMNSILGATSPHLPSEARLTLNRSAKFPYFPMIIEYFQRRDTNHVQGNAFELMTRIEFKDPTTEVRFDDKEFSFRINDTIEEIKDETQDYLPTTPIPGLNFGLPSR